MASTATITPSELAPKEKVRYSLVNAEPFELGSGDSKDVDVTDTVLLAAANDHPWLTVTYPEYEGNEAPAQNPHIDPKDDVLAAAHGSLANDPEAVAKDTAERPDLVDHHTAIDAGLDQKEEVFIGLDDNIAQTLAAEDAADEAEEAPKKSTKTTKGSK